MQARCNAEPADIHMSAGRTEANMDEVGGVGGQTQLTSRARASEDLVAAHMSHNCAMSYEGATPQSLNLAN